MIIKEERNEQEILAAFPYKRGMQLPADILVH